MVKNLMGDEICQPEDIGPHKEVIDKISGLFTMGASACGGNKAMQDAYAANAKALRERHKMSPLQAFRWCVRNWKDLRDSPIFTHVSNLMAIGITLGFLPESWGKVEMGSVTIFQLTQQDRYKDALSIVDGIMNATEYFVEAAVASWECGNFLPFFFERHMSRHMDELFEELQETVPTVLDGSYRKAGGNWGEVILKLQHCRSLYAGARDVAPPRSLQRKILQDRVMMIQNWHYQLISCIRAGDVVPQPYCNITLGAPRCGKTSFTHDLIKINSIVNLLKFSPEMIANMAPGDEFHSQVHNHTVYLIYDDIAANKPMYDKAMGIVGIIQSVNNMRFVAVKAEAELKGKVMPELCGVFGTTNIEHMNSHVFANTLSAVEQRYVFTKMYTRPNWATEGGAVNKTKVKLECKDYVEYGGIKYKDISTFDILMSEGAGHRIVTMRHPQTGVPTRLEGLNIAEAYFWHEQLMRAHRQEQLDHVQGMQNREFAACQHCRQISCVCPTTTTPMAVDTSIELDPTPPKPTHPPLDEKPKRRPQRPRYVDRGHSPRDSSTDYLDSRIAEDLGGPVSSWASSTTPQDVLEGAPEPDFGTPGFFDTEGTYHLGAIFETDAEEENQGCDVDEEPQGAIADAVYAGVKTGVQRWMTTSPHIPMLFTMGSSIASPFYWGLASDWFTAELMAWATASPGANWWFWIPEYVWNLPFMPRLANYLKDDELYAEIKAFYADLKWYLPVSLAWLMCSGYALYLRVTITTVLLFFLPLAYWVITYLKIKRYQECAYAVLSYKRELMGHMRDAQFVQFAAPFKILLGTFMGAAAMYGGYKAVRWLYKEWVEDIPRDPNAPNDLPGEIRATGDLSLISVDTPLTSPDMPKTVPEYSPPPGETYSEVKSVFSGNEKWVEVPGSNPTVWRYVDQDEHPPSVEPCSEMTMSEPYSMKEPPSLKQERSEVYQGFMSVTSEAVKAKEKEIDVWRRMIVEKRATYRPPNGIDRKSVV